MLTQAHAEPTWGSDTSLRNADGTPIQVRDVRSEAEQGILQRNGQRNMQVVALPHEQLVRKLLDAKHDVTRNRTHVLVALLLKAQLIAIASPSWDVDVQAVLGFIRTVATALRAHLIRHLARALASIAPSTHTLLKSTKILNVHLHSVTMTGRALHNNG